MGMVLQRVEDPRDRLDRALADEIYFFAVKNGVEGIDRMMPREMMIEMCRAAGKTNIDVPDRPLGVPVDWRGEGNSLQPITQGQKQITAQELMRKQWEASKGLPPRGSVPLPRDMSSVQSKAALAKQCKALGIKMARTDTKEMLLEKLRGQATA